MNFRILHSVWAQYRGTACFLLRAEGCHTVSLGVGERTRWGQEPSLCFDSLASVLLDALSSSEV